MALHYVTSAATLGLNAAMLGLSAVASLGLVACGAHLIRENPGQRPFMSNREYLLRRCETLESSLAPDHGAGANSSWKNAYRALDLAYGPLRLASDDMPALHHCFDVDYENLEKDQCRQCAHQVREATLASRSPHLEGNYYARQGAYYAQP